MASKAVLVVVTLRSVPADILKKNNQTKAFSVVTFALALPIDLLSACTTEDLVTSDDRAGAMMWETRDCMPHREGGHGDQYR
jgi:hypothetical protein